MWRYSDNLRALYETPAPPRDDDVRKTDRARAGAIIDDVRTAGRTILTEFESKELLAAYGIPDGRDAHRRAPRRKRSKLAAQTRLPGRAQALLRDHHAQDRRRRRAA